MENKNTFFGPIVVGIALIISTSIGGLFFLKAKSFDNNLSVTGSAKTHVRSDMAKWSFSLVRKIKFNQQKDGYVGIAKDIEKTKAFLISSGVSAEEILVYPPALFVDYDKQQLAGIEPDYQLSAQIVITTPNVDLISKISQDVSKLVDQGVYLTSTNVEYLYSKLPEIRVQLSGEAIKDAKKRAEAIAQASGQSIGNIKSVSGGVIQVVSPNSVEFSDYGSYDTNTIEKDVTFSVRAAFLIN